MNKEEIERKFIVNPNSLVLKKTLKNLPYKLENRYYLYRDSCTEIRFTSISSDGKETYFNLDRMEVVGNSMTNRKKDLITISKDEFDCLLDLVRSREPNIETIIRKSYSISKNPQLELKIYGGKFDGLIRAEVEFSSNEEADKYKPLNWFGKELTNTPIGNDVKLPDLSSDEFTQLLKGYLD